MEFPMPKVLISDSLSPAAVQIFKDRGVEVDVKPGLSKDELLAIIGQYDGLAIRSNTKVTAEVLKAAANLKVVGRAGIGVDNVDIPAATARGVIVMNTPFGNSITTAEHAIALIFALARDVPAANASTHAGKWEKNRFMGVELTGKVLGLIGCGNIGSIVADRALGLKMKVIAFDPFLSPERAKELGVEKVELDDLLPRADFITLHTPMTAQTRGILSAEALAKTKKGVRIVNCARGGLIDEAALKAGLDSGHLAGAALDVFETEPAKEHILFGNEKVVATPHLGASTGEAQENVALQVAEQISDYLLTGAVTNAINMPSISAADAAKMKPWISLAEKLGAFAGQLTETSIQAVRDRLCRHGRQPQSQGPDPGGARRAAEAGAARRQHGQRAGRRPRARHPGDGIAPRRVRRLRRGDHAARHDARLYARRDRHRLRQRRAAHRRREGHRAGGGLRAAPALRHQRGQTGLHRPSRHAAGRCEGQHRHLQSRPRRGGERRDRPHRGRWRGAGRGAPGDPPDPGGQAGEGAGVLIFGGPVTDSSPTRLRIVRSLSCRNPSVPAWKPDRLPRRSSSSVQTGCASRSMSSPSSSIRCASGRAGGSTRNSPAGSSGREPSCRPWRSPSASGRS